MPVPFTAPVLNALSIGAHDSTSITLAQPTFATVGVPAPTVLAYIGYGDTIAVSGSTVSNYLQGPIDVSGGSCQFTGLSLSPLTRNYTIVVVAANSQGYSVEKFFVVHADKGYPSLWL